MPWFWSFCIIFKRKINVNNAVIIIKLSGFDKKLLKREFDKKLLKRE